jgi:predicted outer membrane lipoprotein
MKDDRRTYWLVVQLLAIAAGIYGAMWLFEVVTT